MDHLHYLNSLFDPRSAFVIRDAASRSQLWFDTVLDGLRGAFDQVPEIVLGEPTLAPGTGVLAVIRVDGDLLEQAITLAAERGARACVAIEGKCSELQRESCRELARSLGVRLLGPATLGFIRPSRKLNAGRLGPLPAVGNVALVSQSGALAASVMDWAAGTPIGFSLVVSLGAEADIDLADVLDYLANDPRTKAVVLYLEAVRDARSFMSAMRSLATIKPVVVLRGGRSEQAARRVRTHSGALCGADAVYSAALRRAGAVEIRLITQMFTAARYLAASQWPIGKRVAVIANGSGPATVTADQAQYQRLRLEPFSASTIASIQSGLPGIDAVNPLVLGVDAPPEYYALALKYVAEDPAIDGVLVLHSPALGVDTEGVCRALAGASESVIKPLFTCWLGAASTRGPREALDASGIPSFGTPETAVDAFSTVATFYQNQLLLQQVPRSLSGLSEPDLDGARGLVADAVEQGREVLTEIESKALLGAFHIPLTQTVLARSPAEAVMVAEQIGFPVVLKISSSDVSHKSEIGGVVLNVRNAAETRAQFANIMTRVREQKPDATIDGVTVQRMSESRDGIEIYIGVMRDPVFGPVIMFGSGGTRVETVRDATIGFAPMNRFLADRMIARTRIGEYIERQHARWPQAIPAIERILVRVSEMVCELPQLLEMDINPVILDENGAIAVDARVVLDTGARARPGNYAHMAILPYPGHLVRDLMLKDGHGCQLRPIRPEDGDALQRFVRGLSDRSRYFRFISTMTELTPRMLARYTQVDYDRELALVAVIRPEDAQIATHAGQNERIVGVVRYLLNPDRETCEFAIAIDDQHQGRGLGTVLMEALVDAARIKGLRRIEGFVLGENRGMLRLMRAVGFTIATEPDDPTMRIVHRDLH